MSELCISFHIMTIGCSPPLLSIFPGIGSGIGIGMGIISGIGIGSGITGGRGNMGAQRRVRSPREKHLQIK